MQINKSAYEKLIKEDIEWLLSNTKDSLERRHIVEVLNYSPERLYASGSSEKPNDLDEAAVDIADSLLAKPKDYALSAKADYWNGAHDGVIAGAKWDREQGVSMEGIASRKYDHQYHGFPSILVCDVSAMVNQLIPQDTEAKVIVQIRKKDE